MSLIKNLFEVRKVFPESVRRTFKFCIEPEILEPDEEDVSTLRNFLETALLVGAFIAILKAALPAAFGYDIVSGINAFVLTAILISNGLVFSLVFYGFSWLFIVKRDKSPKWTLLYQPLKLFAAYNFLLASLMVIGVNRVVVNLNHLQATNTIDLLSGGVIALLIFWLLVRTLIKPVSIYFEQYYSRWISISMVILITAISSYLNPSLGLGYFKYLIDSRKFCENWVERKYHNGLVDGTVNFHQKLFECVDNYEKLL